MKKIASSFVFLAIACSANRDGFDQPPAPTPPAPDPFGDKVVACDGEEANSYVGCDAWPTPVANAVWSVFDFAVVVANAGDKPAQIVVERGGKAVTGATVEPNGVSKIFLPWIPELKGKDSDMCGGVTAALSASVRAKGGAYHLKSDRPVTVYQFNALEYAPVGGPPDKDWTACPGYSNCNGVECFSYTNDASLLFPTRALKGTYRITGIPSESGNAYFAITGTKNGTKVSIKLSTTAKVLAGGGIAATDPNGTINLTLDEGDVVEIVGDTGKADLSGSLVTADQAVQVISGHPCRAVPNGIQACDHLEQVVVPAETLGKHYFVSPPTGPYGGAPGHVVRLYGNADGTTLTYPQGAPANAPKKLDAGTVVDLDVVDKDFEVVGDHEFAIASFMMGGSTLDTATGEGDPSQTIVVPVEQYRTRYVFLAPDDYDTSWVDAIQPMDAMLKLDGLPVTSKPTETGSSGYGINRVRLTSNEGAHVLESDKPFGVQVIGYGKYTSYMYPGGLDLKPIAPPPPR
jgi:hypothetical protein